MCKLQCDQPLRPTDKPVQGIDASMRSFASLPEAVLPFPLYRLSIGMLMMVDMAFLKRSWPSVSE